MSIQTNTYIILGARLDYPKNMSDEDYERLEPYRDDASSFANDGVTVLLDGMCGKYLVAGKVIAKTSNHGGFEEPIDVLSEVFNADGRMLSHDIRELLKLDADPDISVHVLTHYR